MSSDLLAEFDSFYRAPSSDTQKVISTSQSQSTSALEDLSFFGAPNPNPIITGHDQPQWNKPPSKPSDDMWGDFSRLEAEPPIAITTAPAPDLWGSFQTIESVNGATSIQSTHEGFVHQKNIAANVAPKPGVIRRSTQELFSSNIADLGVVNEAWPRQQTRNMQSNPINQTITYPGRSTPGEARRGVVLFDAADELARDNEDDDFGDFESVSSPIPQIDLLQLGAPTPEKKISRRPDALLKSSENLAIDSFPYPQAPKSPSFRERNPFADLALSTSPVISAKKEDRPKIESPVTAWPVYEPELPKLPPYHDAPTTTDPDEEDWGDFEDLPTEPPTVKPSTGIEADAWAWDAIDSHSVSNPPAAAEVQPPNNIPPPSVLLGIFPQLFHLPQPSLFKAVSNQTFALKNRILSDPSTIDFLRAYILLATVAARIIAGRKLRWKRDIHLSQAMKIGPAGAHGKSGMKLTGVDKAEATRDDREAAEVVHIWREQVGRLRSAVATANSSLHDQSAHLVIPEINEPMVIKTEGALTAPKPCILCGLKREERVLKVDFQVEDSFGEWWVEHWGHRACRNFWQEHVSKLKQR